MIFLIKFKKLNLKLLEIKNIFKIVQLVLNQMNLIWKNLMILMKGLINWRLKKAKLN